jgi:hypothetical protein
MTGQVDIERYLDDWLGNAPMDPADRVVVSVAVRIRREHQRPAAWFAWQGINVSAMSKLAAVAAGVVLVGALAFVIPGSTTPPPSATSAPAAGDSLPTPTPTPTPSPSPSTTLVPIGVSLSGGLPEGWTVIASGLLSFEIREGGDSMGIELLSDQLVMDAGCAYGPEPGVGYTPDAFIGALAARPGVTASSLGPAEVGGLAGRQADLRGGMTAVQTCGGFIPLFGRQGDLGWGYVGLADGEHMRLIALDVPGGRNVVVMIDAADDRTFDRYIDDATAIVDHLAFDTGP